jgi:hypothetical protein
MRSGGGLSLEQLAYGESTGAQEAIEGGGRQFGLGVVAGQRQMKQQCGASAMRVLALEPFDERGGFGRDGALLTAVQAWLGSERGESVAAIA